MAYLDAPDDAEYGPLSAEAALSRLLIEAGSLILRAPDEQTLFERICRLLIKMGGFRLAWVALMEPAGDRLVEVALAGHDVETLAALREHARSRHARSVLTRRLKDREPWVIDIRAEREGAHPDGPWASLAALSKVASVAYLPIVADHVVHGVLVLATDDRGYFSPDRLLALGRLPSDLAVKLDWLGRHAGDPSRDEALRRAAARLRAFFDAAPHAILLVSPGAVEVNATFAKMFGTGGPSTGGWGPSRLRQVRAQVGDEHHVGSTRLQVRSRRLHED
jgi:PAS domain-containing protein